VARRGSKEERLVTYVQDLDEDEPAETSAAVGLLIRETVAQIRPQIAAVTQLLDELVQLAGDLERRGDAVPESGSAASDLLAVLACHLPNELRGMAGNLRNTRDLLKLPVTTDGQP
jgi:hypothetical protein